MITKNIKSWNIQKKTLSIFSPDLYPILHLLKYWLKIVYKKKINLLIYSNQYLIEI